MNRQGYFYHSLLAWRAWARDSKAIHLTGADVFITSRDPEKGKQITEEVLANGKPGKVEVVQMDLGSLESIRAASDKFLRRSGNRLMFSSTVLVGHLEGPRGRGGGFSNFLSPAYLFSRDYSLPPGEDQRWI